jgi:hypothetical protein
MREITSEEIFNATRLTYTLLSMYQKVEMADSEDEVEEIIGLAEELQSSTPVYEVVGAAFTTCQALAGFLQALRLSPALEEDPEGVQSFLSGLMAHAIPFLYRMMRDVGGVNEEFFEDALVKLAAAGDIPEFLAMVRPDDESLD